MRRSSVDQIAEAAGRGIKLGAGRGYARMSGSSSVGYIGWAGHGNLGDEALFSAFQALFPGAKWTAFGGVRVERALLCCGLSGPAVLSGVFLGGGTLVNAGYLPVVYEALEQNVPMFMFGTGVGNSGFGDLAEPDIGPWKPALDRFKLVSVRGPRSLALLENAGIAGAVVVGDPALSLALAEPAPKRSVPMMAVNLTMAPGGRYGVGKYECFRSVASIARKFRLAGGNVIALGMSIADQEALRSFAGDTGLPRECIATPSSAPEFLRLIKGAVGCISVRLHGAVLSCCAGVPPILLSYRDKCADFMDSMGLQQYSVPLTFGPGSALAALWKEMCDDATLPARVLANAKHWQAVQRRWADRIMPLSIPNCANRS